MLDIVLDFTLDSIVVLETLSRFAVYQQPIVIVEAKKFAFLCFINYLARSKIVI